MKIMISEAGNWADGVTFAATAMNDATVAGEVGIIAAHGYNSTASQMSLASFSNVTTQHLWETEVSDFAAYDGSITSALTYATQIHQWLTAARVNAWTFWYGPYCLGCANDNQALAQGGTSSFIPAKRMYMMGNWAKFVKPGCNMVSVSNPTSLQVTAFACPSSAVVVAINNSASDATNQVFSGLSGAQVTPWITSGAYDLQSQAAAAISGGTVSYTIPAYSIVTLVSPYSN